MKYFIKTQGGCVFNLFALFPKGGAAEGLLLCLLFIRGVGLQQALKLNLKLLIEPSCCLAGAQKYTAVVELLLGQFTKQYFECHRLVCHHERILLVQDSLSNDIAQYHRFSGSGWAVNDFRLILRLFDCRFLIRIQGRNGLELHVLLCRLSCKVVSNNLMQGRGVALRCMECFPFFAQFVALRMQVSEA